MVQGNRALFNKPGLIENTVEVERYWLRANDQSDYRNWKRLNRPMGDHLYIHMEIGRGTQR